MQSQFTRRFVLIAVTVLMLTVMTSTAFGQDATPDANGDAATYCTDQEGTIVTRYPAINVSAGKDAVRFAGAREFCEYRGKETGIASVPVEVMYADQPTLAVIAYLNPPAFKPTGSTANPSYFYCQQLNGAINFGAGADSGWINEADPTDVINPCVFADGSMIDAFALFYKSDGTIRGADLTAHFRWKGSKDLTDLFK